MRGYDDVCIDQVGTSYVEVSLSLRDGQRTSRFVCLPYLIRHLFTPQRGQERGEIFRASNGPAA